jgi:hypothetical protein
MNSTKKYQAKLERKKRKKIIKYNFQLIQSIFPFLRPGLINTAANNIYNRSTVFSSRLIEELICEGPSTQAVNLAYQGFLGCDIERIKVAADIAHEAGQVEFGDACISANETDILYFHSSFFPVYCVHCRHNYHRYVECISRFEDLISDDCFRLKNKNKEKAIPFLGLRRVEHEL